MKRPGTRRTLTALFTALACAAVVGWVPLAAHAETPEAAIRKAGLEGQGALALIRDLTDGVGGRLTGSPNMRKAYGWAARALTQAGATKVALEDAGEFGLSWRLDNVWMRMTDPDVTVLQVQAAPWSVSSHGAKAGDAVAVQMDGPADFERYRGTLRGKIVLLGPLRPTPSEDAPLNQRWTNAELDTGAAMADQAEYFANLEKRWARRAVAAAASKAQGEFLRNEGVLAVVVPSREMTAGHGGTGLLVTDNPPLGAGWTSARRMPFPVLIAGIESFGRAWRLTTSGQPVRLQFDVTATTLGERERIFNVVGEIPGSDPTLASQVVLIGAHLDSWGAGTGAADNGSGVAAAIETLRLLRASGARPRRTIRVVLFGGEEQGRLGSLVYVARHIGGSKSGRDLRPAEQLALADLVKAAGYDDISVYFNLDHGSGRIRAAVVGDSPQAAELVGQWTKPLADLGVRRVFAQRDWPNDVSSFEAVGVPSITYVQDPLDYDSRAHHSNLDTLERISPADLAQLTTVNTLLVLAAANNDHPFPRTPLR